MADPSSRATPDSGLNVHGIAVEFRRSARRSRTISARLEGNRLIVHVPLGLAPEQEQEWAERLGGRILAARRRRSLNDDHSLVRRAAELNRRYFGGRLPVRDVRYVTNQQGRFASCTPKSGIIRVSDRVATLPAWVQDAILVHELAHLREPNHSARFWDLANRYPLMERARGFLLAISLEGGAAWDADVVDQGPSTSRSVDPGPEEPAAQRPLHQLSLDSLL